MNGKGGWLLAVVLLGCALTAGSPDAGAAPAQRGTGSAPSGHPAGNTAGTAQQQRDPVQEALRMARRQAAGTTDKAASTAQARAGKTSASGTAAASSKIAAKGHKRPVAAVKGRGNATPAVQRGAPAPAPSSRSAQKTTPARKPASPHNAASAPASPASSSSATATPRSRKTPASQRSPVSGPISSARPAENGQRSSEAAAPAPEPAAVTIAPQPQSPLIKEPPLSPQAARRLEKYTQPLWGFGSVPSPVAGKAWRSAGLRRAERALRQKQPPSQADLPEEQRGGQALRLRINKDMALHGTVRRQATRWRNPLSEPMKADERPPVEDKKTIGAYADVTPRQNMTISVGPEYSIRDTPTLSAGDRPHGDASELGVGARLQWDF